MNVGAPRSDVGAPVRAAVVVLGALLVLAGSSWLAPGQAAAQTCGPAPAGQVAVAVVVDSERATTTRCVIVPDGTVGYEVLSAAGHQLRIESGFLCAIDGVPSTGCANRSNFDGSYWRYFHGTPAGGWSYSNVGGGGYRMPARCAVEGWRWATGGSASTPPRTPPPVVACDVPVTVAPTVAPPVVPPVTPPIAPPAAAPSTGGTVAGPGATVAGTSVQATPTTAPVAGAVPGAGDTPIDPSAPSTTLLDPAAPDADAAGEVSGETTDVADDVAGPSGDDDAEDPATERQVDETASSPASRSGGGSPVGLLVAAVVVAGLAGGAFWRSRRESTEGP